jgi:hypothetical protein
VWPQLDTQLRGDCKMQLLLMLELSVHVSHVHDMSAPCPVMHVLSQDNTIGITSTAVTLLALTFSMI